ncbi:MAG: S41 family peptidase [Pseudomonadota bacterium]|nr:S41 family peptidase [Pseudomonadota bacterium]
MKHNILFAGLVATLTLFGCEGGSDNESNDVTESNYSGVWDRKGYGELIEISNSTATLYQYTVSTCLKVDQGSTDELFDSFGVPALESDDKLIFKSSESQVFNTSFTKITQLPEGCHSQNLLSGPSPETTVEHFIQSFDDYYAFFNERGVSWSEKSNSLLETTSPEMSDQALFSALSDALAGIDDGHVMLTAETQNFRPVKPRGANRVIEESFEQQTEYTDIQEYANHLSDKYTHNLSAYFDDGSVELIDGTYGPSFIAATINDGQVGYLSISNMAFLSTVEDGLDLKSNLDVVDQVFPEFLDQFSSTHAMVVDIRNNSGGMDEVALRMVAYFLSNRQQFGSKFARTAYGEFNHQQAWVEPATDSPYLNPVILITGGATASAAEIFTLAMKSLPQVTQIGESTSGMLSDVLEKELPNGWGIWMANEVYQDINGQSFESIGIEPEQEVLTFSIEAINSGKNPAIELALQLIQ